MWDERGNLVAEGRYDMGARTGRWTQWQTRESSDLYGSLPFSQARPPFISQATFENDLMHGEWTIYDVNQQRLSRITFRNGLRHGPATLWLPTGQTIRQMNFVNGELDGDVMEADREGKLVKTATYQQGRRFAEKITYFKGTQNRETQAQFLFAKLVPKTHDDFWMARFAEFEAIGKDERHGLWVTWYENGQVQVQGEYHNDMPVGKFTWWHSNGQKYAEGEFVAGHQHGVWQWWHKNGQKWTQGEFNNGEQTGEWSSWNESGRLDQQASYSGGRTKDPEGWSDAEVADQDAESSGKLR
jgi:antitoxin component YwqK of YwqJK toxin-antitoxin module